VMILTLQSSTFLFYVVTYHFHLRMVCTSPSWFDTQENDLRMRTFQNEANYLQKSWCCRVIMNFVSSHHFANSTVVIMTLFAIKNYHWHICWMTWFIKFVRLSFPYWFWLRGTWSYLCICRRSVLPYTRFCTCPLDYNCVLHILNFTILYL
jgi:hypothetical protein